MLKYYKNFILCNDIDYYCLLCQEPFICPEDVEKHLRWEKHRKLMKNQACLSKFSKDAIYKIEDKLYYCEICNNISSSLSAVKTHVTEESHKTNKGKPENAVKEVVAVRKHSFIKIPKGNVFIFERREWHCIVNNFCIHCDESIDAFDLHAALPSHMLKFMQSKLVKAGKDHKNDIYYRKINENKYYCFRCKKTFPSENFDNHWTEVHTFSEDSEKPKMLFILDIENDMGTCTLCHKSLEGYMQMSNHKKDHIAKNEWQYNAYENELHFMQLTFKDKGKQRHFLKNYGKENFIKLNEGGSKGYCSLCHTHISAHIRNFRQHVGGTHHQSQLEVRGLIKKTKKIEIPKYKTKPFNKYVSECILLRKAGLFLIPDSEVCIDLVSFALISSMEFKDKDKFVCYVCDGIFTDLPNHLKGEHKQKMFNVLVITSIKDEFIREVRPGLYHCGVCNQILGGYSILEKHLKLLKHRFTRLQAHRRIEDYVDPTCLESAMFDIPLINTFRSCKTDDTLD